MGFQSHLTAANHLPLTQPFTLARSLSFLIVLLMTTASAAGILCQTCIYPTDNLRQMLVPNDLVNLLLGMPILVGSIWLTQRGTLIGLLFWPGALFYALYNYIVYVLAAPINAVFLMYLAIVVLTAYTMVRLAVSIDAKAVQQRLAGATPTRLGGGVLTGLGILFLLRAIGVIFNSPAPSADFAVAVADLVVTPAWIVGGAWLWRRHSLGYVIGLGLLFQASMLFVGLIVFMLVQPLLTTAPFVLADVGIVFAMGLVCFIPFALFVRGVASKDR